MNELKPLIISPPFGNYINRPYATSVEGSFTYQRREGLIYHSLRSIRPVKGGWRNQIGLRNPGIQNVIIRDDAITSVVGGFAPPGLNATGADWRVMLNYLPSWAWPEVNLSCPNVHEYNISPETLAMYQQRFPNVIAKLPPTPQVDAMAAMCIEVGIKYLHLSNTIPTERGGISGEQLFEVNLPIVRRIAERYGDKVIIIAGGGIYSLRQLMAYQSAGAKHFSISSIFFTPWRVSKVTAFFK